MRLKKIQNDLKKITTKRMGTKLKIKKIRGDLTFLD
jgi:hypothetical protein